MNSRLFAALSLTATLFADIGLAQTLSDAEIEEAITLGTTKPLKDFIADSTPGLYDVAILGRLGRVAYEAANAKKAYRPFSAADVSEALRRDEVRVLVIVDTPVFSRFSGYVLPPPLSHVVIKAKDGTVIQPLEITPEPQEWSNAVGGKLSATGATVRFQAVPAGDFDVIVISSAGEDRYAFKGKNRQKIR